MANELVLITGGSGHVGFKTLIVALEHGYRVRAVVRSDEKAKLILATPSIKRLNPGDRLTFSIVPDFLAPSAFTSALEGVDYAIHLASPITGGNGDFETQLIQPAVKGTLSFLESAKATPSIKRVVITSSVAAVMTYAQIHKIPCPTPFTETSRVPDPHGPYNDGEFEAYCSAKAQALNAAEKWKATHNPRFSLVHIHPGFVIGRDELVTSFADFKRGTNIVALANVLGTKNAGPSSSTAVHLDDVARAHVEALDSRVPDGQSLILASEGLNGNDYDEALEVVAKTFPKAVKKGIFPNNGNTLTHRTPFDKTETLKILGWEFKSFSEAVVDVAGHYLSLLGEEEA